MIKPAYLKYPPYWVSGIAKPGVKVIVVMEVSSGPSV
jgi:hypothetical protein